MTGFERVKTSKARFGHPSALGDGRATVQTVRLGRVQPQAPTHRTIYCNDREANFPVQFQGNSISTMKYNIFSFIPKGLFEQFRRVANLYFFMISILSATPFSLGNIEYIVGAVIFTGHETKVMMNAMNVPSKRSTLERKLDKLILAILCTLFGMCIIGAFGSAIFVSRKHWYLGINKEVEAQFNPDNRLVVFAATILTLITLFSTVIPISLYVSIEIEYIFSDKAGTLTRNMMEFLKCSIGGELYGTGLTEIEMGDAERNGMKLEDNVWSLEE